MDETSRGEGVERHLVLVSASIPGKHLLIDAPVVTIGRGKECTVVVDHESVSRCHVRLSTDGVLWTIADLDSRNGTRLNDRRLLPSEPKTLKPGDVIEVGPAKIELTVVEGTKEDVRRRFAPKKAPPRESGSSGRHTKPTRRLDRDELDKPPEPPPSS